MNRFVPWEALCTVVRVDSQSGLAHSTVVTPANVHDKHPLPQLPHGREKRVDGDSAYASQKTLMHDKAPQAKDFTNERVRRRKDEAVDEIKRTKNRNLSPNKTVLLSWPRFVEPITGATTSQNCRGIGNK